jgi:hypothetical protein
MQPCAFSFLAVNDKSIGLCMWNLVWRYVMNGLWSVQLRFISSLGSLHFCLHHNIHSLGTYLPWHIITVHQLFSVPCKPLYHANNFTFTVHWVVLTDYIWVFSEFAGKLQFIHICLGVRSDYKILVFWKLDVSVIGITILHIPFSHDIILGFRCCFIIEI